MSVRVGGLPMSFEHEQDADTSNVVIRLEGVGKQYRLFQRPSARLLKALWPRSSVEGRVITALAPIDLTIRRGEAVGIVGRNGAGKSTLLQLVCGTLTPSQGRVSVIGNIGALLELGAGFNPEFSGRENVFLAASVMGLQQPEIEALYDEIVAFSGIGDFIDQPVKTYSSGMYVRLAFSIATCISPDILVIDEALSVGDGAFAKQSFERIMSLRELGTTVLFCSHSLYQVEAFCDRAIWLDHGEACMDGPAPAVVAAYNNSLRAGDNEKLAVTATPPQSGHAHIRRIEVEVDGVVGTALTARSLESHVRIQVAFASDPALPCPVVATGFALPDGQIFTAVYTLFEGITIERNASGDGEAIVVFERIPLMKGRFSVGAYLFCERAIHVYDYALEAAHIDVTQPGVAQGFVHLPHYWESGR